MSFHFNFYRNRVRNRVETVNENKTHCTWCNFLDVFRMPSSVNYIKLGEKVSRTFKGVGMEILTETFNLKLKTYYLLTIPNFTILEKLHSNSSEDQ